MGSISGITNTEFTSTQSKGKIRLTGSPTNGTIGTTEYLLFGGLGNINNTAFMSGGTSFGWWWGTSNHTAQDEGLMALSGTGKLTVANSMRLGYGTTDTISPGSIYTLDVNGDINLVGSLDVSGTVSVDEYIDAPAAYLNSLEILHDTQYKTVITADSDGYLVIDKPTEVRSLRLRNITAGGYASIATDSNLDILISEDVKMQKTLEVNGNILGYGLEIVGVTNNTNLSALPQFDYNIANKEYVDTTISSEIASISGTQPTLPDVMVWTNDAGTTTVDMQDSTIHNLNQVISDYTWTQQYGVGGGTEPITPGDLDVDEVFLAKGDVRITGNLDVSGTIYGNIGSKAWPYTSEDALSAVLNTGAKQTTEGLMVDYNTYPEEISTGNGRDISMTVNVLLESIKALESQNAELRTQNTELKSRISNIEILLGIEE